MEPNTTIASTRLRQGTSEAVKALHVDDIVIGWTQEVVVKVVFKAGTSLDQIVSDRDKIRENYYNAMQRLYADAESPNLYFILDEERPNQTLEYTDSATERRGLPF